MVLLDFRWFSVNIRSAVLSHIGKEKIMSDGEFHG